MRAHAHSSSRQQQSHCVSLAATAALMLQPWQHACHDAACNSRRRSLRVPCVRAHLLHSHTARVSLLASASCAAQAGCSCASCVSSSCRARTASAFIVSSCGAAASACKANTRSAARRHSQQGAGSPGAPLLLALRQCACCEPSDAGCC